jgi:hypothetical protein
MKIKINPIIAYVLSFLIVVGYFADTSIIQVLNEIFNLEFDLKIPVKYLIVSNLVDSIAANIGSIVSGIWLVIFAKDYGQDRHTWFLLGLCFGIYTIPLFMLLVFIQEIETKNIRMDQFKSLKSVTILLIGLALFFSLSKILLAPLLSHYIPPAEFGEIKILKLYSIYYWIGLKSLTKVVLMISVISYLKARNERPWLWAIGTLFLGIFPLMIKAGQIIFVKFRLRESLNH